MIGISQIFFIQTRTKKQGEKNAMVGFKTCCLNVMRTFKYEKIMYFNFFTILTECYTCNL